MSSPPRAATALALAALALLPGCGRTLVFGERDAVDLSIRATSTGSPPLEVNVGIDRRVASIVPPRQDPAAPAASDTHRASRTTGEAINMFSGFRVAYAPATAPQVFGRTQIRTQFASGAAAVEIAGTPEVVNRVVDVSGQPTSFTIPPDKVTKVTELTTRLRDLPPARKVALARALGLVAAGETVAPEIAEARIRERFRTVVRANDQAGLAAFESALAQAERS